MFRLTCRLNHACVPNVRWTYDAEKRHIYTRAIMDIREGEELFVTYMRPDPDGHYDAPADKDTTLREYLLRFMDSNTANVIKCGPHTSSDLRRPQKHPNTARPMKQIDTAPLLRVRKGCEKQRSSRQSRNRSDRFRRA